LAKESSRKRVHSVAKKSKMNYLYFLTLSLWTAISVRGSSESPSSPSREDDIAQLCLYINSVTITDSNPVSTLLNADTKSTAIIYVYDTSSSEDTTFHLEFPIIPEIVKDIKSSGIVKDIKSSKPVKDIKSSGIVKDLKSSKTVKDLKSSETVKDIKSVAKELKSDVKSFKLSLPESNPRMGCWIEPLFHELSIRFKVNQLYHTALKAVSSVLVPALSKGPASQRITLQTLPGQLTGVKVEIELTLSWSTRHVELSAPITDPKPIDSAEINKSMTAYNMGKQPVAVDQNVVMPSNVDKKSHTVSSQEEEQTTDWFFVAACISAALGAIVLCYIGIAAYRSYGRSGYENIAYPTKCSKLKGFKRISLRNIAIKEESSRNIMHPSASYTFDD